MPLRIGLAGLGIHGERYARHLLGGDVQDARLSAVCRRNVAAGEAFAREHGVGFCPDPVELAARRDVDAVLLVLPPHLHGSVATACLREGKPILVEKPIATSRHAALGVVGELERRGGWLMVGHTLRFDAVVARLREEVGALGRLHLVAVNQRFEPTTRPWIDEPGPGGILLNTGVHGFDLLRHLTGCEPVSITATCSARVTTRTDDEFAGFVRLAPGDVLATIDNMRSTRSRSGRIEIVGENGQIWGDHVHRTLVRVRGAETTDLGPVPASPTIPATLGAFVRAVLADAPPPITAFDGLAAVELAEAAARSARKQRCVELSEIRARA